MERPLNKRILVVEDNEDSRELLVGLLQAKGYQTDAASNGKEAMQSLTSQAPPSLILLDLTMPVMDGWQLHGQLKQHPELKDVPVVVVSAIDESRQLPKGIAGVLPKPIDIEVLYSMLERHCPPA